MAGKNTKSAFPRAGAQTSEGRLGGMSLLEYFAAEAMQALLTREPYTNQWNRVAIDAFQMADYMVAMAEAKEAGGEATDRQSETEDKLATWYTMTESACHISIDASDRPDRYVVIDIDNEIVKSLWSGQEVRAESIDGCLELFNRLVICDGPNVQND